MQRTLQNRLASVLLMAMLCASLLVAGCSPLGSQRQKLPAKAYLLQAPEETVVMQSKDNAGCLTLVVNTMHAAPGFDTSRIAYVQKDYQLDYFANHQWADTPTNMLTTIVTQVLEDSNFFHAVLESPAAITADLRLNSELMHLQQIFKDGESSVQLELRMILIDQGSRAVVASQTFSLSEIASENTPYEGVLAANRAVARLLPELMAFIDTAINEHTLGCQN